MVETQQPFDVVWFPDGMLRTDSLEVADLAQYRTLILPECRYLTPHQRDLLLAFLEQGGRVVTTGDLGSNLPDSDIKAVADHPHVTRLEQAEAFGTHLLPDGGQVKVSTPGVDLALNIQEVSESEAALHIIRYDYDEVADRVAPLPRLDIDIRLGKSFDTAIGLSPTGPVPVDIEHSGSVVRLALHDVPLYCVVLLQG
jgi:hypothetical protein